MNIFEKLQNCRVELQKMELKKSGNNKFAGYTYYELSDFMPKINMLFAESKLFSMVSFTNDIASLQIINSEKPDEIIEFTSPMRTLELKGCNQIQALGGVETYQRRYLYMLALEITESDMFDGVTGKHEDKQIPKHNNVSSFSLTDKQITRLYAIAKSAGKSQDDVKSWIKAKFNKESTKELTKTEYDQVCEALEKLTKQEVAK